MMPPDNAALQAKLDKAVKALEEIATTKPDQGPEIDTVGVLRWIASTTLKELTND
jgi:hypothetical protein